MGPYLHGEAEAGDGDDTEEDHSAIIPQPHHLAIVHELERPKGVEGQEGDKDGMDDALKHPPPEDVHIEEEPLQPIAVQSGGAPCHVFLHVLVEHL